MNKKGFTLVEILAVIIVMAVVATIVVTSAYSLVKSNNEEQYNVLISEIEQAVKLYLSDNYENYVVGRESKYLSVKFLRDNSCDKIYIKLSDLISANLIKEASLVDPRDNNNISKDKYVKVYYDRDGNLVIDKEFSDTASASCDSTGITYDINTKEYSIRDVNNYVSLNNQIWRIFDINKDGSMRLILDGNIGSSVFGKDGSYNSSYVLASMQYWYIYEMSRSAKNIVRESSLSLLTNVEYENLTNSVKGSDEFWILNYSDNTGLTTSNNKNYNTYSSYIRPVIELKPTATYVSGNGSASSPYTVR